MRVLAVLLVVLTSLAGAARAGTTGKLSGRVTNEKKEPLMGANVQLVGVALGAATDAEGRYTVINIPAGKIAVRVGLIGHQTTVTQGVDITADNTTRLDIQLKEAAVTMQDVVVTAKRPIVELNRTSSVATVTREQIQALPVQELQDVVNLQAGVVDGHFRGGRSGEVQYQVDGVTVNNAFDNSSTLKLDRSLLEEVQVISGTFDAEYGQAMSGVVNAVLKRGSEKFHWDAELFSGGYAFNSSARLVSDKLRPAALQNYQVNVSGPSLLPRTTYLISARHSVSDDYILASRRFEPTDTSDFEAKVFHPTGDGSQVPLGFTHEWSGIAKLTNRLRPGLELSYQAIFNVIDGQRGSWAYRFNPDGQSKQRTISLVQGMDFTHSLSKTTFYTLNVRQNFTSYRDFVYEDVFDPRYDAAGQAKGDPDFELGAYVQGVDFTRFKQKTNGAVFKGSFVNQMSQDQQLKVGFEFQAPHIQFGSPGHLVFTTLNGVQQLVRHVDDPPDFPGIREYRPFIGAAFGQEEIEWNDLTLRAGARLEYFDARASLPSDLANPANSITGAPPSPPRATSKRVSIAPRLGVSYPINKSAALFFAYGHFYQFPGLGEIFQNADYSVLQRLQTGGISYGVLGNPDIKPERTVQYQFGYKQALTEDLGLDVNVFYKDIRDLLGVEFVSTYNDAEYARLTNVDFGNVIGFTVSLDRRASGLFSSAIDYTWQTAQGNASDPRETATRASAGEDPRPRQVPFNWDQRHTLNLTLTLAKPQTFSASSIIRVASGQPYTPAIASGFGGGLEANSGRKPLSASVDLRGERNLSVGGNRATIFARVFNLLDTRYFNGFVFANSGSPYYSRYPSADLATLNDPSRFFGPRRIEIGLTMSASQ